MRNANKINDMASSQCDTNKYFTIETAIVTFSQVSKQAMAVFQFPNARKSFFFFYTHTLAFYEYNSIY